MASSPTSERVMVVKISPSVSALDSVASQSFYYRDTHTRTRSSLWLVRLL